MRLREYRAKQVVKKHQKCYNTVVVITQFKIENFRSFDKFSTKLTSGLNIFVGKNAQGKTNLLESIYFCGVGKSSRTNKEKELIKWDKERARISVELEKQYNNCKIDVFLSKADKKTIRINGIPIKRMGELMGELMVIYFSPDEIRLIKDAPQDRRRFMDIDISQMSKHYFYLLLRYEKILNQRNKLLKQTKSLSVLKDMLSVWDSQLAETAGKIIISRIKFITLLSPFAAEIHSYITDGKEDLTLSYQGVVGKDDKDITEKLLKAYSQSIEKDFDLGYTTVGPHRDDIKVMINDIDIRSFGSQGQQRLATLSMKLAELKIFKSEKGETPVLLLDDVLSELDSARQRRFLDKIKGLQIILTCTKYDYTLGPNDQKIQIDATVEFH
ncbi:MAG: DNA replication/repair protein RecF [Christensenellaceae bacterium]|jgi:DNA replication and repair protein RecF|nr:DNA replication/repair protein RecF [Christensenellaceae bacterium]